MSIMDLFRPKQAKQAQEKAVPPPQPAMPGATIPMASADGVKTTDGGRIYTVKAGDTLSKIAKEHLGSADRYMAIFEANRDVLKDPDKIFPGQTLKIPAGTALH